MLGHIWRRAADHTGVAGSTGETAPAAAAADSVQPQSRPSRRLLLLLPLLPVLALLVAAAVALGWDGVYPGVRAGGVAVGGLSREEAAARLVAAGDRWEAAGLTLVVADRSHQFTRADLGLRYEGDATVAEAFAQGRRGAIPGRLAAIAGLAWGGRDITPAFRVDEPTLRARLEALAGETDITPRDGDLRIEGGQVIVTPPVEGRGLHVDAAVERVIAAAGSSDSTAVALPVAERSQPRINADALAEARSRAEALLHSSPRLTGPDLDVSYDPAAVGGWLQVRRDPAPTAAPLAIAVERERVRATLSSLAPQVAREPQDAVWAFDPAAGTFVVVTPEREGRRLDVDHTADGLVAALEGRGSYPVRAVVHTHAPALTAADVADAGRRARRTYLAGPLAFTLGERSWTIAVEQLGGWLTIEPGPDGPRLAFDEEALSDYIVALKPQVNRPVVDATYTIDEETYRYRVTGASQTGRSLDGPATFAKALEALTVEGAGRRIALPVTETRPRVTEADVAALKPERWIAVDLTKQRMYAMVDDEVVYTAVISSGERGRETPTGTFYINRRVANETMTSASIGAEEYYHLENVLYTQYFTYEGHALHYAWWRKDPDGFGRPSSHGCVNQTLRDAEYFWNFARVGTRVTIAGRTPAN
ncbi:MAG: L,D-transpeptidase/peptidoglycan binding protein [Chloroflexota bacterium]|nr:L,D-transpeptidase/peptidoglycan binding protein [Chloroflexota bacterium]